MMQANNAFIWATFCTGDFRIHSPPRHSRPKLCLKCTMVVSWGTGINSPGSGIATNCKFDGFVSDLGCISATKWSFCPNSVKFEAFSPTFPCGNNATAASECTEEPTSEWKSKAGTFPATVAISWTKLGPTMAKLGALYAILGSISPEKTGENLPLLPCGGPTCWGDC